MAGRFMKVKRIIIPFMTLVILTSQLAGCATLTAQETLEESQKTSEVIIEYNELDTEHQQDQDSSRNQQIQIGDTAYGYEFDGNNSAIGIVDTDEVQEQKELSGDALINYFQRTYDACKVLELSSLDEQIDTEIEILVSFCDTDRVKLPADYADQYRAWRPVDEQSSNQQQAQEAVLTFTEVNEQVWATGTVNFRSGPSTENEKVGALNQGNSVTRIGIGTGDYANWSKVKLSDGTEVYVATSYLTTIKLTTQNKPSNSGGNSQDQTQNQGQQGELQQNGNNGGPIVIDPWEGVDPKDREAAAEAARQATQKDIDATQGTMH